MAEDEGGARGSARAEGETVADVLRSDRRPAPPPLLEQRYEWLGDEEIPFERYTSREYFDRESHDVWGKWFLLTVVEADQRPSIKLKHNRMILKVRPDSDDVKRQQVVEDWYREQVKSATTELIPRWEPKIGVKVEGFYVRRMKTRWGSCNSQARTIRLNADLAKKPRECLEYIAVHEMIHILVPTRR